MSDDAITAAITSAATTLESSSATSEASLASDSGSAPAAGSDPTGAVDIPSTGDAPAEAAVDPNAQEVGTEEIQDPSVPAGSLPLHRHKAVLTNERNKHAAAIAAVQAELAPFKSQAYQDRMKALDIAESQPELFVQVLKQDPRYAALLATPASEPAQPQQPKAQPQAERPGPDRQDAEGNLYYSPEQATALLEYQQQAQEARVQKMLEERFAPIEKQRQEQAQREQQQQMWGQALERQKGVLADARATWPHFADLEPAIKADLAQNPSMTLETAYRRAFIPKAQADRDAMRKQILAELRATPAADGAVRPGPGPAVKPAGPTSMEDTIAGIAARLERANA